MVSNELKEIVNKYLKELKQKGIQIDKAILFGSAAKGNYTSQSDIDIMIVSKYSQTEFENLVGKIWNSKVRIENNIEPHLVEFDKFYGENYIPIVESAKLEGIEIPLN